MQSSSRSHRRLAHPRLPALVLGITLLLTPALFASDQDDGRIRMDSDDIEIGEGSGSVSIAVRYDGQGPASVDYSTVVGSAEASDFVPTSGTLNWPAGDDEDRFIVVQINEDELDESDEFFSVILQSPSPGTEVEADKSSTVVTIEDNDSAGGGSPGDSGDDPEDDPSGDDSPDDDGEDTGGDDNEDDEPSTIKFDERSLLISEDGATALVVVERSHGEDGAVSVQYRTVDGTATSPEDYTTTSGTLDWADNDGSNRVIQIPILEDSLDEGQEEFSVELFGITGNGTLDPSRSTLRVFVNDAGVTTPPGGDDGDEGDDDRPGTLKFDQRTFTTIEGNQQAVITVERSQGEGGSVSVSYATSDGTAREPADYAATAGVLEWGPGDGSVRSFTIDIVDDDEAEGSETVNLELFAPTGGATIDPTRGVAVLTILDNDGAPAPPGGDGDDGPGRFKFSERGGYQVPEGAGSALIGIERSGGGAGAVSVRFETTESSATAGSDYAATTRTIDWAPFDESTKFVEVPIFDDGESEGNEVVNLRLVAPTGGAGLDPERFESTLTILDDDSNQFSCVPSAETICLQNNRFAVDVVYRTRQGDTGRGQGRNLSESSAILWFFDQDNVEILIKTLDGCQVPGLESFWVFFAATTDVDYTLRVTDTRTGLSKEYGNLLGQAALPVQDVQTFTGCGL